MGIPPYDLFRADISRIPGADLYAAVESLILMHEPQTARMQENYLLDYKSEWNNKAVHSVAALANTFGGLILVGITDIKGRADQIVGVSSKRELKTRLASSISTNIIPAPPYEIAECELPHDTTKRLAVIRDRQGSALHLVNTKGDHPVYVRNEDESVPANAAQLQLLMRRELRRSVSEQDLNSRLVELRRAMYVTHMQLTGDQTQRLRSNEELFVALVPTDPLSLNIDSSLELKFKNLIGDIFTKVWGYWVHGEADIEDNRSSDWYEARFLLKKTDYEMKWRLTSTGDIALVTQIGVPLPSGGTSWSLADMALNLFFISRMANTIWSDLGYLGDDRISVELRTGNFKLHAGSLGYDSLFYPGGSLTASIMPDRSNTPQPGAAASLDQTYFTRGDSAEISLTPLLNRILRSLGHSAHLDNLKKELRTLFMRNLELMRPAFGKTPE